ncbi:hypothetical protein OH76DRAFT_1545029, partial [Lentinus brumalis]
ENGHNALKWTFYSGLRGQQAFPVLALEPSIVQDSVIGGEGSPSPKRSVTGLSLKDLDGHIAETNKHLPGDSKIGIFLYNGPKAFVVTGPSRVLYGLVTHLRKVRAPSGCDQSKIPSPSASPSSQCASSSSASRTTASTSRASLTRDLENQELWKPEDLGIPVYHTENGT